jgi:hypothetical protein
MRVRGQVTASARRHHGDAGRIARDAERRRDAGGAVSSAVLYLAIVALWAVVLVPMWLRRDSDVARPGLSWLPHRRPATLPEPHNAEPSAEGFSSGAPPTATSATSAGIASSMGATDFTDSTDSTGSMGSAASAESSPAIVEAVFGIGPIPGPRGRWRGRGAVMARRRRRTCGLSLVVLAAVGCVLAGLIPYWTILPATGLLAGHLSLLRVAAGMDAARREALALARAAERAAAEAAHAAREAAAQAVQAEIIDLMARNRARDVFDQYATEGLRVVGD